MAASVLLSRVLGLVREGVLAYREGTSASVDAYKAAFQIPDLLNYLLAGAALSIAFLPLYTKRRAEDPEGAERLFRMLLGNLGTVAVVATALLWIFADALIAFQYPSFSPELQALCVRLTRIVLPAQIFFITGGLIQTTLLARGRFLAAALAPLLYNASIIGGGIFLAPRLGVEGFAWGALAGAFFGPLLVPLLDARGRVPLVPRLGFGERDFWHYLWVAAPLMIGMSLLTVDEWYDRWFGAALGTGVVATLAYARQLMQAPVAVVGQAIGAASLPAMSRLHAEGQNEALRDVLERVLRAALGLGILAAGATMAVAAPLVALVYERGAFDAGDTRVVADLLTLFAVAVPAWVTQQVASRAFYARGDTWRPMILGTAVALLAVPLYWGFGQAHGATGLAAAGALAMSVNAIATLLLGRRLHGAPRIGRLAGTSLRALGVGGAATLVTRGLLPRIPWDAPIAQLAAGAVLYALVALPGIWLLGDRELRRALTGLARRLRVW